MGVSETHLMGGVGVEEQRKLIVGFDLGEDYSQISCYSFKIFEPKSVCLTEEEEHYLIPTVLCVKNDTKEWLYGDEAIACDSITEGVFADALLAKISAGETVKIFDIPFTGILLLEKFFRKTLMLLKKYFPTESITKIVVTIRDMEPKLVEGIYEALALLGLDKDRATILSHAQCYLYYALSQNQELWRNDVGLFEFDATGLSYYQININRRLHPMIAGVMKQNFADTLDYDRLHNPDANAEYTFKNIANNVMYKQIISTLYFTGKGFEGSWADEIIKSFCTGRRAFKGQNLYTKGACYAARELTGEKKFSDFLFLSDEMIMTSVTIHVYQDGMIKEVVLTKEAVPWYEVNESVEVILDAEQEIEIYLKNIMSREIVKKKLLLNNLPERPNRMTRLLINLTCLERTTAKINVMDLGFGAIYEGTDRSWELTFEL